MKIVLFIIVIATVSLSTAQVIVSKGCCVAIAIDQSTSLEDEEFANITKFVSGVIDGFEEYGEDDGQKAAVCVFSTRVTEVFGLNDHSRKEDAMAAVLALEFQGGTTSTDLAIDQLGVYLRECPTDYNRAGLIITDGNSDEALDTRDAARRFKNSGNLLIVVGIGFSIAEEELKDIATSDDLYFPVANTVALEQVKVELTSTVCSALEDIENPNECERCTFMNGLYVYPDAQYCYIFHSCINSNAPYSYERPCPFGQFFDIDVATCRRAAEIRCPTDPCASGVSDYPNHLICSAYYVCSGRRTVSEMCCEDGERYQQGAGCVADSSCVTPCPPVPKVPVCDRREYAQDETKYEQRISTENWKLRDCAPGTAFNLASCNCTLPAVMNDDPCENEFYAPFDKNVKDIDHRLYVMNPKPKVSVTNQPDSTGGKAAQFDGNNQLMITGYAHAYWGEARTFQLGFLETTRVNPLLGEDEVLFGNGDCDVEGSISVSYDRANNEVKAKIVTIDEDGNEATTRLSVSPVSRGAMKNVQLQYDGSTATLTVDNSIDSDGATGPIAQRYASLQIGSGCVTERKFEGYIDEFIVYPCIP